MAKRKPGGTRKTTAKSSRRGGTRVAKRRGAASQSARRAGGRKKMATAKKTRKSAATRGSRAAKKKAATPRPAARKSAAPAATPKAKASRAPQRRPPSLDRERRTVTDEIVPAAPPSSLNLDRSASAARSGRAELAEKVRNHTSTGPAMTAGDLDADWESAESVGDEAPGGDNPTPDQDVVDEIGRALGVEYDDDEELRGGDEITDRDRNRWELDPASRDDYDDRDE